MTAGQAERAPGPGPGQHPASLLTVRARSAPRAGRPRGAGRGRRPAEVRCQLPQAAAPGTGGARISRLPAPARGSRPLPRPLPLMLPPQPLPPASARSPSPPAVYSGELGPLSRALPPPRVHAHTSPRNELSLGSRQRTRSLKFWGWAMSGKKKKNTFYLRFKAGITSIHPLPPSSFVLIAASLDS